MKLIAILIIVILLSGCMVFPISEVYAPRIEGTVISDNGTPLGGARVTRIENKSVTRADGNSTSIQVLTDSVLTDKSGRFVLESKSEVSWVQGGILSGVFLCYGNFEVEHEGFTLYRSQSGEYERETDSGDMCEGVSFESTIVLTKSN